MYEKVSLCMWAQIRGFFYAGNPKFLKIQGPLIMVHILQDLRKFWPFATCIKIKISQNKTL